MNKQLIPEILLIVFLFGIRIYGLEPGHLYDYDAVSNYLVICEMAQANWQHFFQHASPGFYLFMLPFYLICKAPLCLQYLSAALNVTAWVIFIQYFYKQTNIQSPGYKLVFYIFIGTSFFLVNSALYFTIENLSVLLFLVCLQSYHQSLTKAGKSLYVSAFLWGCLYTVNYKAVLILPIFLLLEVLQQQRKLNWMIFFRLGFWAMIPIGSCILVGWMAGLPYWKYPAVIYLTLTATSSGGMGSQFGADLGYYVKYLIYFENPLLLPGLGLFLYSRFCSLPQKLREGDYPTQLFFFSLCFFAGMSLLLKAPRGLAFIYPFLYGLACLAWVELFKNFKNKQFTLLFYGVFSIGILGSLVRVQQMIYPFTQTHYPEVAQYLKNQQINKIAVTVGLKLIPFAESENLEVKTFRHEKQWSDLRKEGYEYVLLDDFYKVVNLRNFEKMEKLKPIKAWQEPSLLAPMLHLEHSEFTRFSFEESLRNQKKLRKQSYQLHLLKISVDFHAD